MIDFDAPGKRGGADESARIRGWAVAQKRAMQQALAELPDPAEYAMRLPADIAEALNSATKGPDGWYLMPAQAQICMPYGLCEGGHRQRYCLGNFGTAVLKELRGHWA